MSKVLEKKALEYADDYIIGKITYEDCMFVLIGILKKAFKRKDDQACLFIQKVGQAVLKEYERKEEKLDRYLH